MEVHSNFGFMRTFPVKVYSGVLQIKYLLEVSVQRWIYYNKKAISLNDLDFSEAYLQEVEFGSDGGVLRIDDDPDGELTGSANEKIILTGVVIPFRKLEWISGSGEVLILGVE